MIIAYAKSDVGKVREMNQDAYYISDSSSEVKLYLLADGMGGYKGGEIASNLAVNSAKKYIETSFCEHISTTDIAKSIDLSESRLRVLFAAVYGVSPHKYLTDVRISAAKEMLWDNDIPLLEIAEKCGFGSQQYFNDTFKKTVGISPGKYRVQFAKKYTDEV